MARQPRIEVEGGLYHIIARGNDRQDVFHTAEHHGKFLSLLAAQKARMPFFLYAYCLMTNHFHLLIERREHSIGAIMQRVLTGYSQWHNRRHRRVGHVFQGRHKSILCQSETYLAELVRYIHLNPVRAGMVELPEDYPHRGETRGQTCNIAIPRLGIDREPRCPRRKDRRIARLTPIPLRYGRVAEQPTSVTGDLGAERIGIAILQV